MKRRAILAVIVIAAASSGVMLLLGLSVWQVPAIFALLLATIRVYDVVRRTGDELATMKRNEERVRKKENERYRELLDTVRAGKNPSPIEIHSNKPATGRLGPSRPLRRPIERMGGYPTLVFDLNIPRATTDLDIWLELGPFDILSGEFVATTAVDGLHRSVLRLQAAEAGTLLALGHWNIEGASALQVTVRHADTLITDLSATAAFPALVTVLSHPLLPRATVLLQQSPTDGAVRA